MKYISIFLFVTWFLNIENQSYRVFLEWFLIKVVNLGSFIVYESLKDSCNSVIKIMDYYSNRNRQDINCVLNQVYKLFLKWYKMY